MAESNAFKFKVLFHDQVAARFEDFGVVGFRACPRIGEQIAGIDPDEKRSLFQVQRVTHWPDTGDDVAGTLIIVQIEDEVFEVIE